MKRLGKYEIRAVLGRGAMGTVYEAWDPVISRRVAIKTVPLPDSSDSEERERLGRFRQEAQAAGGLGHPNIVGVFDYAETEDLAYIVMEFVDGRTLKAMLEDHRQPELAETGRLMDGLLQGLAYSHGHQVIHRDIKPANVIVTAEGTVKVADFGIARIGDGTMTQIGAIMGTPAYMSPEQFQGTAIDARTDVYSAGVVLFQLLTGKRPFEGSMATIMNAVLNQPAPRPSQLSAAVTPALDAVVARAMARTPGDRFPTAAAFNQALQGAIQAQPRAGHGAGADATIVVPATPARANPRSRKPLVLASAAVLLLAGGGAFWVLGRHVAEPTPPVELPVEPALPAPDASRRAVAAAVQAAPCSVATGDNALGSTATLRGVAGRGEGEAGLRRAVQDAAPGVAIDWEVVPVDGPYCDVLDAVRPYARPFGSAETTLGLALADGRTDLMAKDFIVARVAMPDFAGVLQLDYVASDGTVLHMHDALDGAPYAALATPVIGEPKPPDFNGWEVYEPFGTDLVIGIASSVPLFQAPLLQDTLGSYLPELRASLERAVRGGARVSAAVLVVHTSPRR